jgi:hypothetical protein
MLQNNISAIIGIYNMWMKSNSENIGMTFVTKNVST